MRISICAVTLTFSGTRLFARTMSTTASKRSLDNTETEVNSKQRKVEDEEITSETTGPVKSNVDLEGEKKGQAEASGKEEAGPRSKYKQVAMMLMYSGKQYYGMQINPGFSTVESTILQAMVKAGIIDEEQAAQPGQKIHFQRAARTDKGVSAAGNVCSLKMNVSITDPTDAINKHLPDDIRVLDVIRTTKGFNSKNSANARTYQYIIPTYALTPCNQVAVDTFRIDEAILNKVNRVLRQYKGTHNFHNFTSGKKPTDKSATRYIMEFDVEPPFEKEGLEFAYISVKGQSFMLHQIRKMIGLMIAIVQGLCGEDVLEKAWGPERLDIPMAPGLGLMLAQLHYDYYNKRYGKDGIHQPLEWGYLQEKIEAFKKDVIVSNILTTEKDEKVMMKWLGTLQYHTFSTQFNHFSAVTATSSAQQTELKSTDSQPDQASASDENETTADETSSTSVQAEESAETTIGQQDKSTALS